MKRRHWIAGSATAAAALAVGVGWRMRRDGDDVHADVDLWQLSFDTPSGPPIALRTLRGRPLILNFWATWCPPCVTEMPLLDAFARGQPPGGWAVLAVAVDALDPVLRFLAERRLDLPVALAGNDGLALVRRLGNVAGGLPFTVVFGADGRRRATKLGAVDQGLLVEWSRSPPG